MSQRKVILFAAFLLLASLVMAQTSNQGTIFGTITDSSNAVVPSAQLTLVNNATGLTRHGVSSARGDYRFDFLPPGIYRLSINKAGFRAVTITAITLQVGQAVSVNRSLIAGAATESVDVVANAPGIDTLNDTRGDVIDSKSISEMPLNGREFLALATLVPGAVSGSRPLDNPRPAKADYVVGYNGNRATTNGYYVDGGDNTSPEYNNMISSPSVDAIQEFSVQTSGYSARFGQAGGGIISVVTKSGTNAFHGSLYEYHRNKVLDAMPHFYTGTREDFPNSLWNQFGGSIGGPIVKNKTFFFFNAEGFHQLSGGNQMVSFAPTDAERIGDVRNSVNPWAPGAPTTLYDPYTGQVISSGILPANLISPIGQKLMALWPEPNYPDNPYFNLRMYRPHRNNIVKLLGRVDHNFSSATSLYGTFNFGNYDYGNPGFTDYGDKVNAQHDRSATVNYTHTFSPVVVNTLGVTYTQYLSGDHFRLNDKNYGREWGLDPSLNIDMGAPAIQLFTSGFTPFFIGGIPDWVTNTHQSSVHDDLSWQKGRHTLQFGGSFSYQHYDWRYFSGSAGYLMNILDGLPGTWALFGVTGNAFTDLLAAIPNVYQIGNGDGNYNKFWRVTPALYFQDDWKASDRLTVNLGVRWEYERPFHVEDGKRMTIDPATGLVRYAAGAPDLNVPQYPFETGGSALAYSPQPKTFMPRIGMAFKPFKSDRTVIRAGYGMYYTSEPAWNIQMGSFVNPFGGVLSWWSKGIVGGWPDGDHLRTLDQAPYGYDIVRGKSPGNGYTTNAPYYPRGYSENWNLSVGHDFGHNYSAEIAYVGNQGINLNGLQSLASYNPTLHNKVTANYPGWDAVVQSKGYNSNYHSLQAQAKKTGRGFTFLAAYTWSHALADASNDTQIENISPDVAGTADKFRKFRSNAGFDVRQRFSISTVFELPFGPGRRWGKDSSGVVAQLLGGWNLTGIWQAQSGFPFSVYDTSRELTDQVCNGNLPSNKRTAKMWFDTSCYPTHITSSGAPGPGDARSNTIYGPGFQNLDLGLHKQFAFTENKKLEFRLEAFNALNHTQLSSSFNGLNWFYNNASGAEITDAKPSREVQAALRFTF